MREMISETKGEKNGCKQRTTSTLSPAASRGPMILFSCAKLQNAPSRGSILSGTTVNRTPESRSLFGGIAVVCTGYTIYKIPGVTKQRGPSVKRLLVIESRYCWCHSATWWSNKGKERCSLCVCDHRGMSVWSPARACSRIDSEIREVQNQVLGRKVRDLGGR